MKSRAQRIREDRIRADRRSAVRILAVVMIGIFVLVGMRSYAAIIQHENNILVRENEYWGSWPPPGSWNPCRRNGASSGS